MDDETAWGLHTSHEISDLGQDTYECQESIYLMVQQQSDNANRRSRHTKAKEGLFHD